MMTTNCIVALGVTVAACVTDLRQRRIPNVLTFGAAAAALLYAGWTGGTHAIVIALEGWLVGVAIFFAPFALGGMGAGDLKLVAAVGAWLGPGDAVWVALYTGVAGGILAILVSLARGYLKEAISNVWLLLVHWRVAGFRPLDELTLGRATGPHLAYAVPIAVGTMVTVWLH